MLERREIISILCLSAIIGGVYSQFGSGGLHGIPIEAECLVANGYPPRRLPLALEEVAPSTSNIQLARHHIIPVNILRDFFNAAVRRNGESNTELSGLVNLMGFLANDSLQLYSGPGPLNDNIRRHLTQMRTLQVFYTMDMEALRNPPLDVLFDAQYLVHSMFHWIPANIFIGPEPRLRSDDPGDGFEENARYVIGEENFQRLNTLRRLMLSYIDTGHRNEYNEAIELLSEISRGRHTPYPFNPDQWEYSRWYGTYNIRQSFNKRRKRGATKVSLVDKDPFCLIPLETIKLNIENNNLTVIAIAVQNAKAYNGFYAGSKESWKDYYAAYNWNYIYREGILMAGHGLWYNAYGYKFDDDSFAVGIVGTDTKNGKDNWVNMVEDFTKAEGYGDYGGQAYFDKNGRPVAIAITSDGWATVGSGWSFIYNRGTWEYESKDDWVEKRFAGRTLSLDSKAPRFSM